jgi:hypothetical protein
VEPLLQATGVVTAVRPPPALGRIPLRPAYLAVPPEPPARPTKPPAPAALPPSQRSQWHHRPPPEASHPCSTPRPRPLCLPPRVTVGSCRMARVGLRSELSGQPVLQPVRCVPGSVLTAPSSSFFSLSTRWTLVFELLNPPPTPAFHLHWHSTSSGLHRLLLVSLCIVLQATVVTHRIIAW